MAHQLPSLPYAFDALEPHIDAQTMEIHHGKHHQAYVNNLNTALEGTRTWQAKSVEDLMQGPERGARGDPHRGPQQRRRPRQPLAVLGRSWARTAAASRPAGWPTRSTARSAASTASRSSSTRRRRRRFGSGWAWLVDDGGKLAIESTANQDSPLMEGKTPDPRPRRLGARLLPELPEPPPRLLAAWWNVVNWEAVNEGPVAATLTPTTPGSYDPGVLPLPLGTTNDPGVV